MKSLTKDQERQLVDLYDVEWSITELARRFRCARSLVRCILHEHGLIVEARQRARGFVPTPEQIKQDAVEIRQAHLEEKKRRNGHPSKRPPANIRVVKVTRDRNGIYLEPV